MRMKTLYCELTGSDNIHLSSGGSTHWDCDGEGEGGDLARCRCDGARANGCRSQGGSNRATWVAMRSPSLMLFNKNNVVYASVKLGNAGGVATNWPEGTPRMAACWGRHCSVNGHQADTGCACLFLTNKAFGNQ